MGHYERKSYGYALFININQGYSAIMLSISVIDKWSHVKSYGKLQESRNKIFWAYIIRVTVCSRTT